MRCLLGFCECSATLYPTSEQPCIARMFVRDKDHNFAVVFAGYETRYKAMLPQMAFNVSMIHWSSRNYWRYIGQIAKLENLLKRV